MKILLMGTIELLAPSNGLLPVILYLLQCIRLSQFADTKK